MPLSRARARVPSTTAFAVAVVSALAAVSCSSTEPSTPKVTGTQPAITSTTSAPEVTTGGTRMPPVTSTKGSTVAASCPDSTVLEIVTAFGKRSVGITNAYADVTLDQSASITLTNYPLDQKIAASGVYQPTLVGEQAGVNIYLSATKGDKLDLSTYESVGDKPDGTRQLNNYSVWTGAGRDILSTIGERRTEVTLTKLDATDVCGVITTPEVSGRFRAKRI